MPDAMQRAVSTVAMWDRVGAKRVLPARLKGKTCGISAIAAQGAEGPRDELHAGVVYVPEVNVLVGDLQLALAIYVQVGAGQQEDIEAICRAEDK